MKCLVQLTQACLPLLLLQLHTRESSAGCLCEGGERENKARQMECSTQGTLIDNSFCSLLRWTPITSSAVDKAQRNGNKCLRAFKSMQRWAAMKKSYCPTSCELKTSVLLIQLSLSLFPHLGLFWPTTPHTPTPPSKPSVLGFHQPQMGFQSLTRV